jgi:hypothetical protein
LEVFEFHFLFLHEGSIIESASKFAIMWVFFFLDILADEFGILLLALVLRVEMCLFQPVLVLAKPLLVLAVEPLLLCIRQAFLSAFTGQLIVVLPCLDGILVACQTLHTARWLETLTVTRCTYSSHGFPLLDL